MARSPSIQDSFRRAGRQIGTEAIICALIASACRKQNYILRCGR
jgi:hypothetical protein